MKKEVSRYSDNGQEIYTHVERSRWVYLLIDTLAFIPVFFVFMLQIFIAVILGASFNLVKINVSVNHDASSILLWLILYVICLLALGYFTMKFMKAVNLANRDKEEFIRPGLIYSLDKEQVEKLNKVEFGTKEYLQLRDHYANETSFAYMKRKISERKRDKTKANN